MVSLASPVGYEVHEFREAIANLEHRDNDHCDDALHSLLDRKLRVINMEFALLGTCKVDVMAPDLLRLAIPASQ